MKGDRIESLKIMEFQIMIVIFSIFPQEKETDFKNLVI